MSVTLVALAQHTSDRGPVPLAYELYSWQESNDRWSFSLLPSPSGVNVSEAQVFNKRFVLTDLRDLKRKISTLPEGATIFWLKNIVATDYHDKRSKKLSYPPAPIIQDIRHYAESLKVSLEIPIGEQGSRVQP